MAIFNIEPKTSKITGGVLIDIAGNNFKKTPLSINPLTFAIINTSTSTASLVNETNGVLLVLPETLNARASFEIDLDFPEAFKILTSYKLKPLSLPIAKDAILVGIEAKNKNNPSSVLRFYISYNERKGYQVVLEEKLGTTVLYKKEQNVNPYDFEEIGIQACGKLLHGYLKLNSNELFVLQSNTINIAEYRISVFSETPEQGVPLNSEVLINKINVMESVSFIGYPTKIVSFTDTNIKFQTFAGEVSGGDIIITSADLSVQKKAAEFKYVLGKGISNVKKQFDCIQAIYGQYVVPTREQLFRSQAGFQWDQDYFLSNQLRNKELFVPSLWDPTTGNLPKTFFQSGVGPYNALKVIGIDKNISEDVEKWYPKIQHGTYFIENVPYYLFSDQSIIEYLKEDLTNDGRSIHLLLFRPKIGIPVSVFSLTEDKETHITLQKKRLLKKAKFTGKVINGTELDTIDVSNIDTLKEEFIVKVNNNNEIINWIVPVAENPALEIYEFTLPQIPLRAFNTTFSRTDIFKQEKTIASKYGDSLYGGFLFGEGIENYGDYTIDYQTGKVAVKLEYLYKDLGVVSFVFDYPAIIEFNKNFTSNKGSDITDPKYSDLETLDDLGYSSGKQFQEFRLTDFPIIDNTNIFTADNTNFKIFIYDEYDNSFDSTWQRVISLTDYGPADHVYEVNSSNGMLRFGNGVHGRIPSKYLKILAGYKPTMKIQYEPEVSNDYWIPKNTDLNLTKQNISSGFLYINRKKLVPSQIVAEFASSKISVFETTEISATVYTQDGEVIPGVEVNFELVSGGGKFADLSLQTNPNGYLSTIYTPSARLEDMAIRVDLFQPSLNAGTHGAPILSSYGIKNGTPYLSLKSTELIQGDLNEILIFKILDDGDGFLPYNNITRVGGRIVLYYKSIPVPAPVKGEYLAGSIIGFADQLPQPFDPYGPNYEPDLRGFYIVGKKTIQARAYVNNGEVNIYSNIVSLTAEYSVIHKGTWTLPTPPLVYDHSQINTATYIDINV